MDGCRPLRRPRHPRRQLRARRPRARARRRRTGAGGADRALRGRAASVAQRVSAVVRWRLLSWWQKVLVIFLASRVITTVIFAVYAWAQPLSYRTTASPDYFTFASLWDGQWYWLV